MTHSDPRLVMITGAGSGIGRATALRYAELGATIIVTDINGGTAQQTADMITDRGGRAAFYVLDVSADNAWRRVADQVEAEHGVPDILINNAGFGIVGGFLEHTKADWDRQLAVNLDGVVNGCREFAPRMVERGRGQIVNISSGLAYAPVASVPSYCTSKAAVRMFSECLRSELGPKGVGVTVICPGMVGGTGLVSNGHVLASLDGLTPSDHKELQRVLGALAERYAAKLTSPGYVARGIVRAARHNWGVVPVRPESWVVFALYRLAPGLLRRAATLFTADRLERGAAALSERDPQRWIDFAKTRAER